MKWLFKLLGRGVKVVFRPDRKLAKPDPYKGFTVEHYPETGRYYPKYKGQYIDQNHDTGIYEFIGSHLFMYANYGVTEDAAWKIIDLVREQRLKHNVRVITRS